MVGRSTPEWIGKTPDSAIPVAVRLRVFERNGGICHLTGVKIKVGDAWECDHVKPLCMGGENREANLKPALKAPHRHKAAEETSAKAKADRVRAKHLGIYPKPKGNNRLKSRPLNQRASTRAAQTETEGPPNEQ